MARRTATGTWHHAAALVLALGLGACVGQTAASPGSGGSAAARDAPVTRADDWRAIEQLIADQKYQAAVEAVSALRLRAQEADAATQWTRALVEEVQLTAALGGVETAVKLLRGTPWPSDPTSQAVLHLLDAHSLVRYLEVYGWEIGQRERIASASESDLSVWTRAQIVAAVDQAFRDLWAAREDWATQPVGVLGEHLVANDYPPRIRGTLRDAVTYLWAEFLSNSAYWEPAQSEAVYRLDLAALAGGEGLEIEEGAHPLTRLAGVLDDLERWHRRGERPEAAFEARLERLRRLDANVSRDADRELLREALERALAALGPSYPWWSVGQADLAQRVQSEDSPGSLVAARELARRGLEAHPGTVGAKRCASLIATLEAPEMTLQAMRSDGAGRRSLLIEHKNLEAVYLRAYAVDLAQALTRSKDYNLLPNRQEVERLLTRGRPVAEWRSDLAPTPDLRQHRTYDTPPLSTPGLYVVVASAERDFRFSGNRVQAVNLIVSDLVVSTQAASREVRVDVRSGATGEALSGVEVELWQLDYRSGHRMVATARTAEKGRVEFAAPGDRRVDAVAIARRDGDLNFERVGVPPTSRAVATDSTAALIFTDRSVYRPGQELLWKVVAYDRRVAEERLAVAANRSFTVELLDANWETVSSLEVESNAFGSAWGRFTLPEGRLLGSWQLRTTLGGEAAIQVEEYKRPTFEVSLAEPEQALRLNRPATLEGEARYYFGLPVVDGNVAWRVTRRPRYPDWWGWLRPSPGRGEELVAGGAASLDAEGRFALTFTPEADEREAKDGTTYSYGLTVEVTDAGGETRSAERTYRLGYVTVEGRILSQQEFYPEGARAAFDVLRSDLDGTPRAGAGQWRLVALAAPDTVELPADEPAVAREGFLHTPGDLLRPRWVDGYAVESRLRGWQDGALLAAGALDHDAEGRARIELGRLEAGAHRLYYETVDPFGASFEARHEFLVAGSAALPLPAVLAAESTTVAVGETARLLIHSGIEGQQMQLEIARPGRAVEERRLEATVAPQVVELPIAAADRQGIEVRLTVLRDHQVLSLVRRITVPPEDRDLIVRFATFRDLLRPGTRERWRVVVAAADEEAVAAGAAEVLAYMYDRSLDLFAQHRPPRPEPLAGPGAELEPWTTNLGASYPVFQREKNWFEVPQFPYLSPDRLHFYDSYGIGGPGQGMMRRKGGPMVMMETMAMAAAPPDVAGQAINVASESEPLADTALDGGEDGEDRPPPAAGEVRSDFSETAFWEPHLVTDAEGAVAFEFTVPDSLTEWNVWVHALTRDLRHGSLEGRARTSKELLVRPYVPRFLREGDAADLKVVVQNAGDETLSGTLDFDLFDPSNDASLAADFGVLPAAARDLPFTLDPGAAATFTVAVVTPRRVGQVALRVVGDAGEFSDGELRALPILPGRFHVAQSRFAALQGEARRELVFADMASTSDPTRIDEQLVVTLDGQLFYSVLNALPYLIDYPYECTEQTLNRFLSTGIVASVFDDYPAVARMAAQLAERDTPLVPWPADDPNRRMALEETPWLVLASGGDTDERLLRLLDPEVAGVQRDASLAKLAEAQTSLGGFPWWPGGPPSPYMTLYVVNGLARALEFGVDVPREPVLRAWQYLERHYIDHLAKHLGSEKVSHETVTYINYVLSNYPDPAWTGDVFSAEDRQRMLDHSFERWRQHSPLLKGYLALTLERAGRSDDARRVFDSVMDSARTTVDEGTFWAPEDRAWLWYNDTIETHAFALRVLDELAPTDERRGGLVHWLMLNKKLNHWKSTRATAEVIYSLVHFLAAEGELGAREAATVEIGAARHEFVFEPEEYTGARNQVVVRRDALDPATDSTIVVSKETPGLLFASATWHFSTEELPATASGDFFSVERTYYRRVRRGEEWTLEPLAEGARLATGDQVEVHLLLRSRHDAEYVHLRDPRPAGFEPESVTSSYKWDLGIGWYEQVRDSGSDFFLEWLPTGAYTFKYRLRANLAGSFRAAPATVQSMYAPEFNAYSAGATLAIEEVEK